MRSKKPGLLLLAALTCSLFACAQWVTNGTNTHHTNTGGVYIGTVPPAFPVPSGKLHVRNLTGGTVRNNIYSEMSVTTNTGFGGYGIFSTVTSGSTITGGINGVYSIASTSSNTPVTGVYGKGTNSNNTQGLAYGVYGEALASNCDIITQPIGVYGRITLPFACSNTQGWAVYADGRTFTPSGLWTASDARLKTNIQTLGGALDMIRQLQPKTYQFRNDGKYARTSLPAGQQYGFLAQDLERVMPEAVAEAPVFLRDAEGKDAGTETIKAVNYNALIPVLTKAIQELEAKVEQLEQKLAAVQPQQAVSAGRLFQNAPNPADGLTSIRYQLPAGVKQAAIQVYDMQGRVVKNWTVTGSDGTVTLQPGELGAGNYRYALVAAGRQVDSKAMVLTGK